jgi:hypothetical protein
MDLIIVQLPSQLARNWRRGKEVFREALLPGRGTQGSTGMVPTRYI